MILTVCPNPSIDCTIELDSLNVGMLNKIQNKVETYSGKALNVAIGVSRLGGKCKSIGFMFENHRRMFEHVLEKEGVSYQFVSAEGNARVNYKIIDKRSMLTEINDRGGFVDQNLQSQLLDVIENESKNASIVVMSGSLPKGVSSEFYGRAVERINKNAKIILDTEKENMLGALGQREVFMVKPNLKELENFAGVTVNNKHEIASACKKYIELGVKYVLVSLGADGAILTDGNKNYYCKSANVAVNSTVGAGDSMVAATCVALESGVSLTELLKCAVSAGTAAVTTSGTNLFYKDKYDEIYSKIYVEEF